MAGPRVEVKLEDKLGGKALKALETGLQGAAGTLTVGVPPDKVYTHYTSSPGRRLRRAVPVPMAQVLAWVEFGTKSIPERPAVTTVLATRNAFYLRSLRARIGAGLKNLKGSDAKTRRSMLALGAIMVADIRQSILGWRSPKNADATVKRKGFKNPLVDSGQLAEAFTATWRPSRRRR